jgi:hypothetical protein
MFKSINLCFAILVLVVLGSQSLLAQAVATSTTLSSVPSTSKIGQSVALTAKVLPAGSTGSVLFSDGVAIVGVGTLDAGGNAQLTTLSLPTGTHSLRAAYSGDAGHLPSTSAALPFVVTAVAVTGFTPAVNYASGSTTSFVAIGDFNGDNLADLAVSNIGDNNISVFLGSGGGVFQPAVKYGVGTSPVSVVIGDFNGDGKYDLVVANQDSSNVSVLLGNGNGTFQAATSFATGSGPSSISVGDFNADGRSDIATANFFSNNVSVLLGNGDGTFQTAVNYASGNGPFSVVSGDFNGDGKTDLGTANFLDNTASMLQGNGNGTFKPAVNFAVGSAPISIIAGDFNADGKADLVTANNGSADVTLLLGKGDGTFQPLANFGAGSGPFAVTAGDFNADGKADLVVSNHGSGNLSILLNNGNGTFQTATNYDYGASGPVYISIGDFDGDGRSDLAAVNFGGNVSVFMGLSGTTHTLTITKAGSGSGTVTSSPVRISCGTTCSSPFLNGQIVTLTATPAADSIFVGWSGDADCQDANVTMSVDHNCIATFNHVTLTITKTGEGSGLVATTPAGINCGTTCSATFLAGQVVTLTVTPAFGSVFSGWTGDADCTDGSLTMAANRNCTATFGLNSFNPLTITKTGFGSGTVTSLGGLNCGPTCTAAIPRGEVLPLTATPAPGSVFAGWSGDDDCLDGTLTMTLPRNCSVRFDLPQTNSTLLRGDFDGDGKTDLAVYRASTGEWFLRLSTQRYAMGAGNYYFVWGVPGDVPLTGDFDGDGKTDISVYRPSTGEWFIRLSTQNYAIAAGNWHFVWGVPGDVPLTGDFDRDGKTDIAVYRPTTGEWFIRLSTQNYVVTAGNWYFQWGVRDDQPVLGDFDGDGKTDIAVYRPSTGEWFIRSSSLNYAVAAGNWYFQWGVPVAGDQPIANDFDGDGKTDIAVYRPSTGEWFLLLSSQGYVNQKGNWHFVWGMPGDLTIRGDFDGDSKADIAVFRPSTAEWYIQLSTYDYALAWYFIWGTPGDVPLRR